MQRTSPVPLLDLVLALSNAFDQVSAVVRNHHERLDGSGYPFRASAETLSLGARIVAVADVFWFIRIMRTWQLLRVQPPSG